MSKFVCEKCGEVEPTGATFDCSPARAPCPNCDCMAVEDTTEFRLGNSEYVGKFPIRQDITVIPADNPNGKYLLDWTIKEYMGPDVYCHFDGWVDAIVKADGYSGDAFGEYAMNSFDDMKIGDKVLVPTIVGGYVDATVTKVDEEKQKATAETEFNLFALEFDIDDRHTWSSMCQINKSCFSEELINCMSVQIEKELSDEAEG